MFGFIKKALGGGAPTDVISQDLGRWNEVQPGLGNKSADYVRTGEGGTVLATLTNTQFPHDALHDIVIIYAHNDNSRGTTEPKSRAELFVDMLPYDVDLIVRYCEVLTAAIAPNALGYTAIGPENMSANLRMFIGQAARGMAAQPTSYNQGPPRKNPPRGLTINLALDVARALGADPKDLITLLFWRQGRYRPLDTNGLRHHLDPRSYAVANPDVIKAASQQLTAEGKDILLKSLQEWNVGAHDELLEIVFDIAGGTAKAPRDAAMNILLSLPKDKVETRAAQLLQDGNISVRSGMAGVLATLGTDTALAHLTSHLETEKSARVVSLIENALVAKGAATDSKADADDMMGYTAIDGTRVDIPATRILKDDPTVTVPPEMEAEILAALKTHNEKARIKNAEIAKAKNRNWGKMFAVDQPEKYAKQMVTAFNTGHSGRNPGYDDRPILMCKIFFPQLFDKLVADLPVERQIRIGFCCAQYNRFAVYSFVNWQAPKVIKTWLSSEIGDLRVLENMVIEDIPIMPDGWQNNTGKPFSAGDLLLALIEDKAHYYGTLEQDCSDATLWPYVAENLSILDQAFGLAPTTDRKLSRIKAVEMVAFMPKPPMRYFGPLLDIATGDTKQARGLARALLDTAPGVDDRLIALLDDSRQAVRASVCEWLAARRCTDAVNPMKKRLKKEKSELARAAILTALQSLGQDISSFVGPAALIKEAEAGLKKANLDKLDCLDLAHMPKLTWANGKPMPEDVLKWWLALAMKLKQPGGNALFEIYLDQLSPDSAQTLSSWVFDSWLAFDTTQPSDAEGAAHAKQHAPQRFNSIKRYYKDLTEEAVFQQLKQGYMSQYLNSGTATKGVLGLTTRVPAARAADQVRQYLRKHGARTSQATSLLEVLAAKGDPISLQVVIAAATRLKQKGVQAKAGEMVQAAAEARGWSLDELGDRTVPTGGLDDDGTLDLPCGPLGKLYTARLGDDLSLVLTNPDGKVIKSLPTGDEEHTKASKKQLAASKKEIKQVIKAQGERLYEALCAERSWPVADWQRDFYDHPVMRRLIERVIWLGVDGDGAIITAFRPTAEGDFTDVDDADVDLTNFTSVRLAHGALLPTDQGAAWQTHLKDYEVKPLFGQFGRDLLTLDDSLKTADIIEDRKGWITDTFTFRGVASKLGYERGAPMDGGYFNEYIKPFKSAGITAVIEFSGNCLPEENMAAAQKVLYFSRTVQAYNQSVKVPLKDVPPVLLSECWNDYRDIVAKGAFDPEWEKKMPW